MALVKGTNSYVTVAEADAYFQERLDSAAWLDADVERKTQALITATSLLDNLSWTGAAVSESQPLAFPRYGSYFDPRLGIEITLGEAPKRVTTSVMELALHLLTNEAVSDSTDSVQSLSLGPLTLTNIRRTSAVPVRIRSQFSCMLLNSGASLWWRAN